MKKERQSRRTDGIHAGGRKPLHKKLNMTQEAFYADLLKLYETHTQEELATHYHASRACIGKYIKLAKDYKGEMLNG